MAGKPYRWVKVADSIGEIHFAENSIAEVNADDKKICMGKHNNMLFAFAHKCPHASGFLANGYIDPLGNVVCPLHRYKFSLKNGRNVSGEGYYLKCWPVEIRDEGIFVGFEINKLFGLF
jgi:3-phenylpropionate/trans-cinnamate dioxygenase ferredoxin subunit